MAIKQCYLYVKRDGETRRCLLQSNGRKVLYFDDSLVPKVTFSVLPSQEGCDIQLISTGFEQVNDTITVTVGSEVTYIVNKKGYKTATDTLTITEDTLNYPVEMIKEHYKLNVDNYTYVIVGTDAVLQNYTGEEEVVFTPNLEIE